MSPLRARGVSVDLSVPSVNSVANLTMRDVIGQKGDAEMSNSLYGIAHTLEEHNHSYQWVYPTLADSIQIAGGAGAWELGVLTTLMPANTRDEYFDIHWIAVCDSSAVDEYELILYAETTQIGRVPFTITANKDVADGLPFQCVIIVNPGLRIRGRLASSGGGDNANFKILGHDY